VGQGESAEDRKAPVADGEADGIAPAALGLGLTRDEISGLDAERRPVAVEEVTCLGLGVTEAPGKRDGSLKGRDAVVFPAELGRLLGVRAEGCAVPGAVRTRWRRLRRGARGGRSDGEKQ
jgi:hypothetical protein